MVKTDSRNDIIINTIYNNLDDGKITIQQIKAYLYCVYELILNILDKLINMSEKSDSEEDYILNYNNFQSQNVLEPIFHILHRPYRTVRAIVLSF